ncbi:High affinity immunoglobulin epsilon receptor subunit gamma [Merluccius polli]|nr:High affinity immunoglobulin epsilon receptor subunit gamma [Merluccius polli]
MEELGEILRGKIVDSFEYKEDLVNDAVFEGEPMKLLQDRCYVADGGGSDALEDMKVCYILDAILIAYSIVLTVLYIRLKVLWPLNKPTNQPEGLTPHLSDTYETIKVEKKAEIM